MEMVKSSAAARKENADNSIVKQMTRTVGIIFCTLTNHREATRIVLKKYTARQQQLTLLGTPMLAT
jgi:hypothetical protein